MANKADSYVCGISDAPLLGETIGRSLDKAVQVVVQGRPRNVELLLELGRRDPVRTRLYDGSQDG